ncbi:MAG: SAP domain-containing protein [Proteobacteria bacterium]|nr:SAP domain-containing protein [Pseudomonadota bacterium]MBU1387999.1 SAP domain-containing protein [Pseudomonadota bacterium]MBU1542062.1 SAP domain-containing protein [Pseudomonadota bacterium]MBU2482846.1 SAP domain-containing protein [Pseudomonadota bacterium]
MNMKQIQQMASDRGIKIARKKKADLIREIQQTEGNFACFGTAGDYCDQFACLFRDMCLIKPKG